MAQAKSKESEDVTLEACCKDLVDVLHRIEKRLSVEEPPDSKPEEGFLELRASLGLRGRIDPVSPGIVKGKTPATADPTPTATARWCDGELVGITWVGKAEGEDYKVAAFQGDSEAGDLSLGDRVKVKLESSVAIDRIEIKKGDQVVAVGGPIPPWQPKC